MSFPSGAIVSAPPLSSSGLSVMTIPLSPKLGSSSPFASNRASAKFANGYSSSAVPAITTLPSGVSATPDASSRYAGFPSSKRAMPPSPNEPSRPPPDCNLSAAKPSWSSGWPTTTIFSSAGCTVTPYPRSHVPTSIVSIPSPENDESSAPSDV